MVNNIGFGNLFHPKAQVINCQVLKVFLPHRCESEVSHGHQGKIVRKSEDTYFIQKDELEEVRGFGVRGYCLVESPLTQRRRLINNDYLYHGENIVDICSTGPFAEYPVWEGQHQNILSRIKFSEVEEYAIFCRLRDLWKEWSHQVEMDYRLLKSEKFPQYNGYPIWKGIVQVKYPKLESLLFIRTKIIDEFWYHVHDLLVFDFCDFFLNTEPQTIELLQKSLTDFVKNATSVLNYRWPIQIGRLILEHDESVWIPDSTCCEKLRLVAATMSSLLASVIEENLRNFFSFISKNTSFDEISMLILPISILDRPADLLRKTASIFLQMATMPRVETKMFEDRYPDKFIDVTNWICGIELFTYGEIPEEIEKMIEKINTCQPHFEELREKTTQTADWIDFLTSLQLLRKYIDNFKDRVKDGRLLYDQRLLKKELSEAIDAIMIQCRDQMLQIQEVNNQRISDLFRECSEKIVERDILTQFRFVVEVQKCLPSILNMIEEAHLVYTQILSFVNLTDKQILRYFEVSRLGMNLHVLLVYTWKRIENKKEWITTKILEHTSNHNKLLLLITEEVVRVYEMYHNAKTIPEVLKASNKFRQMTQKVEEIEKAEELLVDQRPLLHLPSLSFDVAAIHQQLRVWRDLSTLHYKVLLHEDTVLKAHIVDLEDIDVAERIEKLNHTKDDVLHRIQSCLHNNIEVIISNDTVKKISFILEKFINVLPILQALRNKGMKERHWREILQEGDSLLALPSNPIVLDLLDLHLIEKKDIIEEVNALAIKEQEIETFMDNMKARWRDTTFIMEGTSLLSPEQLLLLNFHISKTLHLKSLSAAKVLVPNLHEWLELLLLIRELVHLYENCVTRWRTIEGVLSTDEMTFQLPEEYKIFKKTAVLWQELIAKLANQEPFLQRISNLHEILALLKEVVDKFDILEAGFQKYMVGKRIVFPRLYMLSDELLLNLLSISRNPSAVKPFLPQLFSSLSNFELSRRGQIVSVLCEKEKLDLEKPINLNWSKRHVEKWLGELDAEVKRTIRSKLKAMIEELSYAIIDPKLLSANFSGVVILYFRVALTFRIENAIRKGQLMDLKAELLNSILSYRTAIKKNTTCQIYRVIGYILVSALEVIENLVQNSVLFTDDIIWTKQIRYYWHLENVFIRIHEISLRYDYEITTKWTDRHLEYEKYISNILVWNHYGLPTSIIEDYFQSSAQLMEALANILGKPLVQLSDLTQHDLKRIQGSLILAAVTSCSFNLTPRKDILTMISRDLQLAVQRNSFKYMLESELVINASSILVRCIRREAFNKSENNGRYLKGRSSLYEYFKKVLRLNSFEYFDRMAQRLAVFIKEAANLFCFSHRWYITDEIVEKLLLKAIKYHDENGFLEFEALDTAIYQYCFSNLEERFINLARGLVPVVRSTSLKFPHLLSGYEQRKMEEILNLLSVQSILTVYGRSLSGKSFLVEKAMEYMNKKEDFSTMIVVRSTGSWTNLVLALKNITDIPDDSHVWVLIDSGHDPKVVDWIVKLVGFSLQPEHASFDNIPKNNLRIIIESDHVPSEVSAFPSIFIETQRESFMDSQNTLNSEIIKTGLELNIKPFDLKLLLYRLNYLNSIFPGLHDNFNLLLVIHSLVNRNYITTLQKSLGLSFSYDELLELFNSSKIAEVKFAKWPSLIYYTCLKMSNLNVIPLVLVSTLGEQQCFLNEFSEYVKNLSLSTLIINLNQYVTQKQIEIYIEAAKSHMFDHENDIQPEVILVFTHIEKSSVEVLEALRCFSKNQKIMAISNEVLSYDRLERRIFPIYLKQSRQKHWLETSCHNTVYEKFVQTLPVEDLKTVVKEEIEYNLNALVEKIPSLCSSYHTIFSKPEEEVLLVHDNKLLTADHMVDFYTKAVSSYHEDIDDFPLNYLPITPPLSRFLCLIEKALISKTNILIILDDEDEDETRELLISWLPTICRLHSRQYDFFSESISPTQERSTYSWPEFVEQQFRDLPLMEEYKESTQPKFVLTVHLPNTDFSSNFHHMLADIYTWTVQRSCSIQYMMDVLLADHHPNFGKEQNYPWQTMEKNLQECLQLCFVVSKSNFEKISILHPKIVECFFLTTIQKLNPLSEGKVIVNLLEQSEIFSPDEIELLLEKIVKLKEIESEINIIQLVKILLNLSFRKKQNIDKAMTRYLNGMEKLRLAEHQAASLRTELLHLQPELVKASSETGTLMSQIERETIEVENTREVVAANENKANQAATQAQALKAECEADLANAIPALEAAIDSLETMNQSDISALKTMRFPPFGVRLCMEAVCILLGEAPIKIRDQSGVVVYDYWVKGQKLLSDLHFLRRIRDFPRDKISNKTMKILRDKYLSKKEFDPEVVKQCSLAAEGLCLWVNAIELYNRISKVVRPKKEKLKRAETMVLQHMKELDRKRKALLRVTEKLQTLSDNFSQLSQKKQELQHQINNCQTRIERTERLVAALEGEKDMWLSKIRNIETEREHLPRTCLMRAIALEVYGCDCYEEKQRKTNQLESKFFPELQLDDLTEISNMTLLSSYHQSIILFNDSESGNELMRKHFSSYIVSINLHQYEEKVREALVNGLPLFFITDTLSEIPAIRFFKRKSGELALFKNEMYPTKEGFRLIISYPFGLDVTEMKTMVKMNMLYSTNKIREKVAFALGRQNWPMYHSNFLSISDQIERNSKKLEEKEVQMMEALGRKDDIDDENAMDILSQTYSIQAQIDQLNIDLKANREKLDETTTKFTKIIDWATNLVLLSRRIGKMNIFYKIPIQNLIGIADVKLLDHFDEGIDFETILGKLSHLYWTVLKNILLRKHLAIFETIMAKRLFVNKFVPLIANDFLLKNTFSDLEMLSSFIRRADAKKPLLIVSESGSIDWIRYTTEMSKNQEIAQFSILKNTSELIVDLFTKSTWVLLPTTWDELRESLEFLHLQRELENSVNVHPDFRMIYAVNNICKAEKISYRYSQRFCLSEIPNLEATLKIVLDSIQHRNAFDRYTLERQKQFLQIIVFHYAVYQRWKFNSIFQMADLHTTLRLYHESIQSFNETDHDLKSVALYEGVIKPIYSFKLFSKLDRKVLETIFFWIFDGIGKTDNALLNKIVGTQWSLETIILKSRHVNDQLLSGYCHQFLEKLKEKENLEIWCTAKHILGIDKNMIKAEDVVHVQPSISLRTKEFEINPGEFSIRNIIIQELSYANDLKEYSRSMYLLTQLQDEVIDSINIQYVRHPERLISVIRAQFAVSNQLPLDEVELQVSLPLMEPHKDFEYQFVFTGCKINGARIENGELKEYWKAEWEKEININIRVVKEDFLQLEEKPKTIPVLNREGDILCKVKIRSNFPVSHWMLRGVYVKTWADHFM